MHSLPRPEPRLPPPSLLQGYLKMKNMPLALREADAALALNYALCEYKLEHETRDDRWKAQDAAWVAVVLARRAVALKQLGRFKEAWQVGWGAGLSGLGVQGYRSRPG